MKIRHILLALLLFYSTDRVMAANPLFTDILSGLRNSDVELARDAAKQMANIQSLKWTEMLDLAQQAIRHRDAIVKELGYEVITNSLATLFEAEERRAVFEKFRAERPGTRDDILTGDISVARLAASMVMLGDGGEQYQKIVLERFNSESNPWHRNSILNSFFAITPDRLSKKSKQQLMHIARTDMSLAGNKAAALLHVFDQSAEITDIIIDRISIPKFIALPELLRNLANRPLTERQLQAIAAIEQKFFLSRVRHDSEETYQRAFDALLRR